MDPVRGREEVVIGGCVAAIVVCFIADEMGFVLYDRQEGAGGASGGAGSATGRSVDTFGPYFIEQYILMEALSKQVRGSIESYNTADLNLN